MFRTALQARRLVETGELDGEVALSYVIWPTAAMVASNAELNGPRDEATPGGHGGRE